MKALSPTTFVIMGVTGDLAQNKLLPGLLDLYIKNALPKKFRLVGFSRRDLSREDFESFVRDALVRKEKYSSTQIGSFIEHSEYVRGNFDDPSSFLKLKDRLNEIDKEYGQCGNKLLYLSVPPTLYEQLFDHIYTSKLSEACGGIDGWVRILVEKPFGNNIEKAQELDKQLGKLFKEEQIFRIDHYLAKEAVQNILTFRFCNTMFEPLWSNKHIESVHIHFFEKNDARKRGSFYDGLGALRDVGQNHLLQMLALIAMEKPKHLSCVDIRKERERVLSSLKVSKNDDDYTKAQYEGYKETEGVNDTSQTETFFSLKTYISNRRWRGVPFHLVAGKGLKESRVEIKIKFHDPDPESIQPHQYSTQDQNTLTFRIQPHEGIGLLFWFKVPGFDSRIEPQTLKFNYSDNAVHDIIPDAYERVLYDCIQGDQTLFTTTKEVMSAWKYIAGVRKHWDHIDMQSYPIGENPFKIGPR